MTPEEQLRARPSFEQLEREYLAMLDEMRAALSGVVPALRWRTPRSSVRGGSLCREPFTTVDGAAIGDYDSGSALGNVPDADWPRAVQVVAGIAARHGLTQLTPLTDRPGDHVVNISGPWGQSLEFGTAVDTTLAVFGPCLLHASARPGASGSAS